jgi:hypothetical protein
VHDGVDLIDDQGTELPDDEEACTQAIVASGEMLKDKGGGFWAKANGR